MPRTFALSVITVLGICVVASASPIVVNFTNSSDTSQFASTTTGSPTFTQVSAVTPDGDSFAGKMKDASVVHTRYSPGAVDYLMGAGTVSTDVDVYYDGAHATSSYFGGLMLQAKTFGTEEYISYLKANPTNGTVNLTVGNLKGSGHTAAQTVQVGTFTPSASLADVGWYNISAAVGTDGSGHYQAVVTVTDPSSNTHTATYTDTGTAQYVGAYPVGFYTQGQYTAYTYYDNFQLNPVPEPATLALVALGLLGARLRRLV